MEENMLNKLLDSLYVAKEITTIFPKLPENIKLSYLYVLHSIKELGEEARVTDISNKMLISSPNITALVNEMEKKGFVDRKRSKKDKRVSYVISTNEGKEVLDKYYSQYKKELAHSIDIPEDELNTFIDTLNQLKQIFAAAADKIDKDNYLNRLSISEKSSEHLGDR